jgi:MHS family proline/betaine transporter-like MFS transporter
MSATSGHNVHGSYLMPSLEHATVADAMHPGIMTCEPGASPTEIARMMASRHVHCMVVIPAAGDAVTWGVVSDLDLIRAGLQREETTAASIASQAVITVEPSTPLRDAARLMVEHSAQHLLVVEPDSQRPVGILSTLDLAGIIGWGEA